MDKFYSHWLKALEKKTSRKFFLGQLQNTKKSTIFFNEYFKDFFASSKKIIDLGH